MYITFDYEPQFVSPSTEIGLEGQGYLADWSLIEGDSNIDIILTVYTS